MSREAWRSFDATRRLSDKAFQSLCYAPHSSLYFDVRGNVRVCCHNHENPVGNIRHQSLDEIWHGAGVAALRAALEDYQFGKGCEFCRFQTAEGQYGNAAMLRFDRFPIQREQMWPLQMEFSISNSCNLECIMCRGQWSSAIRAHREKLPPLPRVYPNEFFDDLRNYLPHVRRLRFLGGEPFLVPDYYRIWSELINSGLSVPCHVTTNGTQFNARIERILGQLPFSFAVSVDGATRQTMESIRVNASFDEVMANARRFREYALATRTDFALTYCLMRQNWHEFAEFCELGDTWDCAVAVNTVLQPPQFGLYTLPPEDLACILQRMEHQAAGIGARLRRNRVVWFGELDRIREKVRVAARQSKAS
jgi:MoaA/NifB/PqqE/SkfB family radical SAM enzyme